MKNLRIVTWNVHKASKKEDREHRVWSYLRDVIKPDIALLQEANVPGESKSTVTPLKDESVVWKGSPLKDGTDAKWGTVIVGFGLSVKETYATGFSEKPGKCVAASVDGTKLIAANIHAPTTPAVFPRLSNCINDLQVRYPGVLIVGGDFNTARIAELYWPRNGHGAFWRTIDNGRMFDCHYQLHQKEINTLIRERKDPLIQDDHILVSTELGDSVVSAAIPDEVTFRNLKLSDHLPLIVDLKLV